MAELKYKTRGNSFPENKPNVFFFCHEKDFPLYFDTISDDILTLRNCTVWYLAEQDAPMSDTFLDRLTQMQLFVFPVSTAFLYSHNPARDILLPFANAHHIPLLPIMQETGLEQPFNELCGDIQFLDKSTHDPTAISYRDKLDRFLSTVLLDSGSYEEIRADFDAHIFLSYRKKDRRHALELMRGIHSTDEYWDVSIWYDEYLTPGESFNASIEARIRQCDLFALAVTPNLVNEDNYVVRKEYPLARENRRRILPCRMTDTDVRLLSERFYGLPPCIDGADRDALSRALTSAIGPYRTHSKENPDHLYRMGLAYLNGVDVEVDLRRALTLLTAAAERGSIPALGQLADMYETGKGVPRSRDAALMWRKRQITAEVKLCEELHCAETVHPVAQAMIACALQYKDMAQYPAGIEQLLKCRAFIQRLPWWQAERTLCEDFAICDLRLGEMYLAEGDAQTAAAAYREAHSYFEQADTQYDSEDTKVRLWESNLRLGDLYIAMGEPDRAEPFYQKAHSIALELTRHSGNSDHRELLMHSYSRTVDLYLHTGDYLNAQLLVSRYYQYSELLAAEYDTPHAKLSLISALQLMLHIHLLVDCLDDPLSFAEKMVDTACRVAEQTDSLEALRALGISLNTMGRVLSSAGEHLQAAEAHNRALSVFTELSDLTGLPEHLDDLALTYYYSAQAHPEAAPELMENAANIYRRLCREHPDISIYRSRYDWITESM